MKPILSLSTLVGKFGYINIKDINSYLLDILYGYKAYNNDSQSNNRTLKHFYKLGLILVVHNYVKINISIIKS